MLQFVSFEHTFLLIFWSFLRLHVIAATDGRNIQVIFSPDTVLQRHGVNLDNRYDWEGFILSVWQELGKQLSHCFYRQIVGIVKLIQTNQTRRRKYNYFFQVCMPVFFYIWIRLAAIYLLCLSVHVLTAWTHAPIQETDWNFVLWSHGNTQTNCL